MSGRPFDQTSPSSRNRQARGPRACGAPPKHVAGFAHTRLGKLVGWLEHGSRVQYLRALASADQGLLPVLARTRPVLQSGGDHPAARTLHQRANRRTLSATRCLSQAHIANSCMYLAHESLFPTVGRFLSLGSFPRYRGKTPSSIPIDSLVMSIEERRIRKHESRVVRRPYPLVLEPPRSSGRTATRCLTEPDQDRNERGSGDTFRQTPTGQAEIRGRLRRALALDWGCLKGGIVDRGVNCREKT